MRHATDKTSNLKRIPMFYMRELQIVCERNQEEITNRKELAAGFKLDVELLRNLLADMHEPFFELCLINKAANVHARLMWNDDSKKIFVEELKHNDNECCKGCTKEDCSCWNVVITFSLDDEQVSLEHRIQYYSALPIFLTHILEGE